MNSNNTCASSAASASIYGAASPANPHALIYTSMALSSSLIHPENPPLLAVGSRKGAAFIYHAIPSSQTASSTSSSMLKYTSPTRTYGSQKQPSQQQQQLSQPHLDVSPPPPHARENTFRDPTAFEEPLAILRPSRRDAPSFFDVASLSWARSLPDSSSASPQASLSAKLLAVGTQRTVLLWDVVAGKLVSRLPRTSGVDIHFNMLDSRILATCSGGNIEEDVVNSVKLWDIREPTYPQVTLSGKFGAPPKMARWSPLDLRALATVHANEVRIWDIRKSKSPVASIMARAENSLMDFDWCPSSASTAGTVASDGMICLWDLSTLQPKCQNSFKALWKNMIFSPLGDSIFLSSERDSLPVLKMCDAYDLRDVHTIAISNSSIRSFDVLQEQGAAKATKVVAILRDSQIRVWNIDPFFSSTCKGTRNDSHQDLPDNPDEGDLGVEPNSTEINRVLNDMRKFSSRVNASVARIPSTASFSYKPQDGISINAVFESKPRSKDHAKDLSLYKYKMIQHVGQPSRIIPLRHGGICFSHNGRIAYFFNPNSTTKTTNYQQNPPVENTHKHKHPPPSQKRRPYPNREDFQLLHMRGDQLFHQEVFTSRVTADTSLDPDLESDRKCEIDLSEFACYFVLRRCVSVVMATPDLLLCFGRSKVPFYEMFLHGDGLDTSLEGCMEAIIVACEKNAKIAKDFNDRYSAQIWKVVATAADYPDFTNSFMGKLLVLQALEAIQKFKPAFRELVDCISCVFSVLEMHDVLEHSVLAHVQKPKDVAESRFIHGSKIFGDNIDEKFETIVIKRGKRVRLSLLKRRNVLAMVQESSIKWPPSDLILKNDGFKFMS